MAIRKESAKDKLIKVFFEELEQTHYSKISVSTLIEKAGTSRTTFYRYYVDIFDMYDKVCRQFIDKFIITVLIDSAKNITRYNDAFFENLLSMIKQQEKYILLLCGENGDRRFFERALEMAENTLGFLGKAIGQNEAFKIKFVIYAGVCTYVESVMNNGKFNIEVLEFTKEILNLT